MVHEDEKKENELLNENWWFFAWINMEQSFSKKHPDVIYDYT